MNHARRSPRALVTVGAAALALVGSPTGATHRRPHAVVNGSAMCEQADVRGGTEPPHRPPDPDEKVITWKISHTDHDRSAIISGVLADPDTPLTWHGQVVARIPPPGGPPGVRPILKPRGKPGDTVRLEQRLPGSAVGRAKLTVLMQWTKDGHTETRTSDKSIKLGKSPCKKEPPHRN